jgi:hypothetical protein
MFESMIAVDFQSVFHSEIHQSNIFYFIKIIFDISISNDLKNIKKILI